MHKRYQGLQGTLPRFSFAMIIWVSGVSMMLSAQFADHAAAGNAAMNKQIPEMDKMVPERIETASFGLG